jgi:hypothetical protein
VNPTATLVTVALAAVSSAAGVSSAPWRAAFSAVGAPAVHLRATYRDGRQAEHRLEFWRDGGRVRRDTDDRLQVFAVRAGAEDHFSVVDRKRAILFSASRATLYRLGSFRSWEGLATSLEPPTPAARATRLPRRAGSAAGSPCRWWSSGTGAAAQRICWSSALRVPLLVEALVDGRWTAVWHVEQVTAGPLAPGVFDVPQQGLQKLDLDEDANPAGD